MDLTTYLPELNVCLQGENHLICAMFQTIATFELNLKLWQGQVVTSNFMHFDTFYYIFHYFFVVVKTDFFVVVVIYLGSFSLDV